MSWNIRIYDMDKFWNKEFDQMELVKVVDSVPEFGKNLSIDGKVKNPAIKDWINCRKHTYATNEVCTLCPEIVENIP